jgi:hypothetical protein
MNVRREHFVVFYSPGSLFSETTTKPIKEWDTRLAVQMADQIVERHGAKPYGFRLETRMVADPIPYAPGDTLEVLPKVVEHSGTYFLGGKLETLDDVRRRNDPKESILQDNMWFNRNYIVVINTNSYRSTHPFREQDFIVGLKGEVLERGDDPRHVAYREACREKRERNT